MLGLQIRKTFKFVWYMIKGINSLDSSLSSYLSRRHGTLSGDRYSFGTDQVSLLKISLKSLVKLVNLPFPNFLPDFLDVFGELSLYVKWLFSSKHLHWKFTEINLDLKCLIVKSTGGKTSSIVLALSLPKNVIKRHIVCVSGKVFIIVSIVISP